jgi:hypothetical protein
MVLAAKYINFSYQNYAPWFKIFDKIHIFCILIFMNSVQIFKLSSSSSAMLKIATFLFYHFILYNAFILNLNIKEH